MSHESCACTPTCTGPEADDGMPAGVGVGFVDVGSGQPGTDRCAAAAGGGWGACSGAHMLKVLPARQCRVLC